MVSFKVPLVRAQVSEIKLTEKVKCKVKNGGDINQSKVCHKFLCNIFLHKVLWPLHISIFSEDCSLCVGRLSLLVGGRNLMHWRRDAEIWDEEGKLDISIADFPFKLGEILEKQMLCT